MWENWGIGKTLDDLIVIKYNELSYEIESEEKTINFIDLEEPFDVNISEIEYYSWVTLVTETIFDTKKP